MPIRPGSYLFSTEMAGSVPTLPNPTPRTPPDGRVAAAGGTASRAGLAPIWRKLWKTGTTLLLVAGCAPPRTPAPPPLTLPAHLAVRTSRTVAPVALEDYVLGTVLAEVAPVGETPAVTARILEVQAIVARSYAAASLGRHGAEGFDLCDTMHCQIYDPARLRTSRFTEPARLAVARTAGVVLSYARRPAEALFHADCGGATAAADAVWGGRPVPYLLTRIDDLAPRVHRTWRWTAAAPDLRAALARDPRTDVGRTLTDIAVATRDESGRASQVELAGERRRLVRGEDFRAAVSRAFGARTIQSTRLSVRKAGGAYVFEGTGFGHGVGLCQAGAAARARRGESTDAILTAYFAGAVLHSVEPAVAR